MTQAAVAHNFPYTFGLLFAKECTGSTCDGSGFVPVYDKLLAATGKSLLQILQKWWASTWGKTILAGGALDHSCQDINRFIRKGSGCGEGK